MAIGDVADGDRARMALRAVKNDPRRWSGAAVRGAETDGSPTNGATALIPPAPRNFQGLFRPMHSASFCLPAAAFCLSPQVWQPILRDNTTVEFTGTKAWVLAVPLSVFSAG